MALAAQTSWLKIATVRAFVVFNRHKHTLPALPYDYNALEPAISAEIMQLHHQKHHATYVNNLNAAEEQLKDFSERGDLAGALALQPALKFNGGGHINHSIFWEILSPSGGGEPHGELRAAIEKDFGSVDNFRTQLSTRSVAVQGSGWGWLGYNKLFQRLEVATCSNQDPLLPSTGLIPLLGIDVWEHAYYLQYKNVRPEYVKNLWDIVNWQEVANRFSAAIQ